VRSVPRSARRSKNGDEAVKRVIRFHATQIQVNAAVTQVFKNALFAQKSKRQCSGRYKTVCGRRANGRRETAAGKRQGVLFS